MWLPGGVQFLSVWGLRLLAGSGTSMLTPELLLLNPNICALAWSNQQQSCSTPSAPSKTHKRGTKIGKLKSRLRSIGQICTVALFLLPLAACFSFKPKQLAQTQAVSCPVLKCLDRAMALCQGVEKTDTTSCEGTTKLASDAMSKLEDCQNLQYELLNCIVDFQRGSKKPEN